MTAADAEPGLSAVPLLNAVFCVECENITNSPHDACTICGSRSLISLFRMLRGTLRSQKPQDAAEQAVPVTYNLELTAKVHEISAAGLNHVIALISRLAEVGGDVKSLHINVESVFGAEGALKAA